MKESLIFSLLSITTILATGRRFVSKNTSCQNRERLEGKSRVECVLICTRKQKLAIYSDTCYCGEKDCQENNHHAGQVQQDTDSILYQPVMSKSPSPEGIGVMHMRTKE